MTTRETDEQPDGTLPPALDSATAYRQHPTGTQLRRRLITAEIREEALAPAPPGLLERIRQRIFG